jgi:hypothetical protein
MEKMYKEQVERAEELKNHNDDLGKKMNNAILENTALKANLKSIEVSETLIKVNLICFNV